MVEKIPTASVPQMPEHTFGKQLVGVAAYGLFTAACAAAIFLSVEAVMGLRVSEEEEIEGLDLGEHGMHAYDLHVSGGDFGAVALARAGASASHALATAESR